MHINFRGHALGIVIITSLAIMLFAGGAGAEPFAYITNAVSNTVSVIDIATNAVIATVNVGSSPVGVAVNPAGTKVYASNLGSNNVSVIDTATNTVTATECRELTSRSCSKSRGNKGICVEP